MKKFLILLLATLFLLTTACTSKINEKESAQTLSKDEVKELFEPLLSKAVEVEQTILNSCLDEALLNKESYINTKDDCYYLVESDNLKNLDDVWELAYSAYTKEAAKRIFTNRLDPNGEIPRFIEEEGKLYYNVAGHGYVVTYPIDTLEIIEQTKDKIVVHIDYCNYDYEPEKSVYVMCKTDEGWRIDNSESESLGKLREQYLK